MFAIEITMKNFTWTRLEVAKLIINNLLDIDIYFRK